MIVLIIFESILPVFLIVALGVALRNWRIISPDFWPHFNNFGFYVLFPGLIFHSIVTADFNTLPVGKIMLASVLAFGAIPIFVLLLWPYFKGKNVSKPQFTSVFQTTTRWHGFMALAIAEKMFGNEGLTFVAVIMLVIILPINFINVAVMVAFDDTKHSIASFIQKMFTNPIIVAALVAIIFQTLGIRLYGPIEQSIDFIARAALGMGLLMIGAGLSIYMLTHPNRITIFAVCVKLLLLPTIAFIVGTYFDFTLTELTLFTIACAVPTANNGYVLAQKMGGDAPLYASIASLQVVASFFTIPLVLLTLEKLYSSF
jgi:malonate transporter